MSQTLSAATNFPDFIKQAKCILISSDDLNNSNFIINQIVQSLCKESNSLQSTTQEQNGKIFGVFLNQTYMSYSFIQMKCGYNLKNSKDRNQFSCLDVLSDFELFEEAAESGGVCSEVEFNFTKFKTVLINQLMKFFNLDNENVNSTVQIKVQSNVDTSRVLIIDDITAFIALNVPLHVVVNFVSSLKHFCAFHQIALIIQTCIDSRLDLLVKLDTYLNSISDLALLSSKLETGYSNKVDGNLNIKNYLMNTQQNYLFKSTERTSKLFFPGTI